MERDDFAQKIHLTFKIDRECKCIKYYLYEQWEEYTTEWIDNPRRREYFVTRDMARTKRGLLAYLDMHLMDARGIFKVY